MKSLEPAQHSYEHGDFATELVGICEVLKKQLDKKYKPLSTGF
jgi:hypothetical protein